ncbi:IucA/IucC family protein, partial [Streptomyces sp. AC563]|nr:IucA/IucC family protein [Streptomyces buecherae]
RAGRAPLATLIDLLVDRLTEAIDQLGPAAAPAPTTDPTALAAPDAVLRARVLNADRLPVKAMVTAGTLLAKERSGAADVNKHYVSGPNYLLRPSRWSR